ncbi:MAG: 4-alpha-glucanotransferase [Acidobacteriaceae bacterium]
MQWQRSSGILLHVTSLPSRFGVGDMGPQARRFADWLAQGKQSIWQMLPLTPTGYGDSPYQALSAFAGNTLLISLEDLARDGLLSDSELPSVAAEGEVHFEEAKSAKMPLLRKAFETFRRSPERDRGLEDFEATNGWWLEDYALFAALKNENNQRAWVEWQPGLCRRHGQALAEARARLAREVETEKFLQWVFSQQWCALQAYCHQRRIKLMGDLPIYVAHDSADVWSHPELFELDERGLGKVVAGVPPDYFSATGQLWGNPIYRWEQHREVGFGWWIERMRTMLKQFDLIRIDHFRGFEAYWAVPGGDKTAERGEWTKAPGLALFTALESALGELPVLAEKLGVITPEVESLRTRFRLPGMAILQFAFGSDPQAPYFTPHNYSRDRVAYTGTHDNDTVMGWWKRREATATETLEDIQRQRENAARYLDIRSGDLPNWAFIRALMASVADAVVFPMQDVLGLGTESRMNYPGTSSGNWRWGMTSAQLHAEDAEHLRELTETYGRE